jgi:hypothetical protein
MNEPTKRPAFASANRPDDAAVFASTNIDIKQIK